MTGGMTEEAAVRVSKAASQKRKKKEYHAVSADIKTKTSKHYRAREKQLLFGQKPLKSGAGARWLVAKGRARTRSEKCTLDCGVRGMELWSPKTF